MHWHPAPVVRSVVVAKPGWRSWQWVERFRCPAACRHHRLRRCCPRHRRRAGRAYRLPGRFLRSIVVSVSSW
tara:strand:+ start:141543 stop:141758 length:216 start_codon:yes stop_codon:yes gene_type:complete